MLEGEQPFSLAARQIEIDRAAISDPRTLDRKTKKLASSSHGFLRGSAPLFYEILARRPDLAHGPEGTGWIAGDMHVENVGAYRTDDDDVVFDLNDFDDACPGPWQLDVLRLTTSVLLASRAFEVTGHEAIDLGQRTVESYVAAAFDGARVTPEKSEAIAEKIEQCRSRKRDEFVRESTERTLSGLLIKRNKRTFDAPAALVREVPGMIADYVRALGKNAPAHADRWLVVDVAEHLAGNGSLGRHRLWVLVDPGDDPRFIELKQAVAPAPSALLGPIDLDPAERVVAGARALLSRPAMRLAPISATKDRPAFSGRRLRAEEDKLELTREKVGDGFPEIVTIIAGLLGRAHQRAVTAPAPARWTAEEQAALVERAVEMAALHEAAWLAYSRRTRALLVAAGPDSSRQPH